jgi:LL-diaminopimelate aminotransferase
MKCPLDSSWDYFDRLLSDTGIVGTPGAGFGEAGEGFFRLSAFGDAKDVADAMSILK